MKRKIKPSFKDFVFKKNYIFLIRSLYLKKLIRFLKRKRRFLRRSFSRTIFKLTGSSYVKFLVKKYFNNQFSKNLNKKRFTIFLRRFFVAPRLYYIQNKALSILLKSVNSTNISSLANVNSGLDLKCFKKNFFRNTLLKSPLSNFKLVKSITLFSKKGNRNSLFNYIFKTILNSRSSLFKIVFFNFYQKFLLFSSLLVSKKKNNDFILSIFIRRFYGFFYKFFTKNKSYSRANDTSLLNNQNLLVLKFALSRLKALFLLSSLRSVNSVFKPFYLYFEVRPWKKSGRSIVVPTSIKSKSRRMHMFSHWFKESSLLRKERGISKKFIGELSDLNLRQGLSIQKLNSMFKTIKSNRALIRKSRITLV